MGTEEYRLIKIEEIILREVKSMLPNEDACTSLFTRYANLEGFFFCFDFGLTSR